MFVSEVWIRDVVVILVCVGGCSDLMWCVGIKCFEEIGDLVFIVGFFIFLFFNKRNSGEVKVVLVNCNVVDYV